MKPSILLALLAISATACREKIPNKWADKTYVRDQNDCIQLAEYSYKGHLYLGDFRGGLIHAEHCPCKAPGVSMRTNIAFPGAVQFWKLTPPPEQSLPPMQQFNWPTGSITTPNPWAFSNTFSLPATFDDAYPWQDLQTTRPN